MTRRSHEPTPAAPPLDRVETLFFDLDGVIADSRGPITECINAALRTGGLTPEPVDRLASWIGIALHEVFESLLDERGIERSRAPELVAAYRERYRTVALTTQAFPGAAEALADLDGRFRLAVVTSKPEAFSLPILESMQLAHHFDAIFSPPLSNTHHEDKTGTLGRALAHYEIRSDPARPAAVMIGDRYLDVAAGLHHGLATIGADWGLGERGELEEAGAHFVAREIGEIPGWLP
ncbi:MAG: HAD hydrolase-like protein [Myxococcota bacterium]|nr:HAD hydrolase-like protein [Myxococcota bacterium]